MITAFISHSTKDRAFVEQEIIPLMESVGIAPWYSQVDIKVSAAWERSNASRMLLSDWILVLLSPSAVQSDWVRSEVHWALENKPGRVIPVRLSPCDPSELHIKLAGIQYADYGSDPVAARHRVAALLGHDSPAAAWNGVPKAETAERPPESPKLLGSLDSALEKFAAKGKYKPIRLLARTGSGMTLLARQTVLNHDVIVKSYSLPSAGADEVGRLADQIQQRSRLRHPILVTPIEVVPTEDTVFVVTQYVAGAESIRECLWGALRGGGPSPPETACQLLAQVALGLSFAHAMLTPHRCLDPWDILVNPEKRVWVAGFERALVYEFYKASGLGPVLGTLRYSSPELIFGQPLDSATDIYHMGIILYELLTGTAPFDHDEFFRMEFNVESLQVKMKRIEDRKLRTLCMKCLQPKKEDRFADAGELFEALLSVTRKKRWWHFWK
jgi:hypothetical protein